MLVIYFMKLTFYENVYDLFYENYFAIKLINVIKYK